MTKGEESRVQKDVAMRWMRGFVLACSACWTQNEDLWLTLPEGFSPTRLPKEVTLQGSFFHYESRWSFADRTVEVKRSLVSTIDQPLCTGETRAEAAKALVAIRSDLAAQIGLKRAE